jgi:hypothetical protein
VRTKFTDFEFSTENNVIAIGNEQGGTDCLASRARGHPASRATGGGCVVKDEGGGRGDDSD